MIGQKKTKIFWHQSEARITPTVQNWSVKTLSPGALILVLDFFSPKFFSRPFTLFSAPTNCPWVSEDGFSEARKHILVEGRGVALSLQSPQTRMAVSQTQWDHFLDFITSPHVIQDLPFGEKSIKL